METRGAYLIKLEPGESQPNELDAKRRVSISTNPPEKRRGNFSENSKCEQCDITYRIHPKIVSWHTKYCHGPDQLVKVRKTGTHLYSLQCVHCQTEFNRFELIIRHLRTKHQLVDLDLPFSCDQCSKQFVKRFALELHQRICNKKKKKKRIGHKYNKKCSECNIAYYHREMLTWHVDNCHGFDAIVNVLKIGDKGHKYQCVQCKHETLYLVPMLQHLRDQHQLANFPYKCNFCSKQYLNRASLAFHERSCNNSGKVGKSAEKKVVEKIKKVFRSPRYQSKNIELKCVLCCFAFIHPEMLTWHIQHCHGENPVIEVLKSGSKKLQCIQCKKQFNESALIIQHLISQHQLVNLPFPCDNCEKQFMTKYTLKRHQISCKSLNDDQQHSEEVITQDIHMEEQPLEVEPVQTQEESLPTVDQQKKVLSKASTSRNRPEKSGSKPKLFKNPKCKECDISFHVHPNLLAWHTTYCHGPEPLVKVIKIDKHRYRCQCLHCRCTFNGFETVLRHLRTKHQLFDMDLPFSCDLCSQQFIRKFKLEEHQLVCMKRKKWARTKKNKKCDKCNIAYGHREMLTWHTKYCHGDNPIVNVLQIGEKKYNYQCIECNAECRELHLIIQHLRDQHQFLKFPYKCKLCSKRFIRRHLLKSHEYRCNVKDGKSILKSHEYRCNVKDGKSTEKAIKNSKRIEMICEHCGLKFLCRKMLTWHFQHCHSENPTVEILKSGDEKLQCIHCKEQFKRSALIIQHLRVHHQLSSLPYACNVCKKQFMTKSLLKMHRSKCKSAQVNTVEHPVQELTISDTEECEDLQAMEMVSVQAQEECPSTEQDRRDETRNEEMNLTCDQCDVTYECPEFMTWHTQHCHGDAAMLEVVKQNDQEHSFQCLQCKVNYRDLTQIIRHLRVCHHLVELPFKCNICSIKQFAIKDKLAQHELNCKVKLACDKCSFDTKSKFQLTMHMKSHQASKISVLTKPKKRPPQKGRVTTELKCDQCNISYGYPEMLAWHAKYCHGPDAVIKIVKIGHKKFDFHCIVCPQIKYSNQEFIIRHIRGAHGFSVLPFQCSDCKKFFALKYQLTQHQVISCKKRKTASPPQVIYRRTRNDDNPGEILTSEIDVEEHSIKMEMDESQQSFRDADTSDEEPPLEHELRECQVLLTKLLECDTCSFFTDDNTELAAHMQTHQAPSTPVSTQQAKSPEKKKKALTSLYCEECCVKFVYSEVLTWHYEHFHGTDPIVKVIKVDDLNHIFQCSICGAHHNEITMITQHLHVEHGLMNLPFPCKNCSKQFLKRYDLIRHRVLCRKVVRSKILYNIKCDQCRMKFAYPEMLAWHVENFHGPNPIIKAVKTTDKNQNFECVLCNTKHKDIPTIIRHLQNQHQIDKFPFKCDVCSKKFISSSRMRKHPCKKKSVDCSTVQLQHSDVNEHTENLPVSCDVQCKICDEVFKTEKQLKNHLSLYHGQIKCDYCDETFNSFEQLESHCHEMHSDLFVPESSSKNKKPKQGHGVKVNKKTQPLLLLKNPVSCRFCGAEFIRKEYLYQHVYNVHTGKFVHCAHCKYSTRRKTHLIRHLKCWHIAK